MYQRERRHTDAERAGPRQGNRPLTLPKLSSFNIQLDTAEERRLQLFGLRLIREVEEWRHRERRRIEGRREVAR